MKTVLLLGGSAAGQRHEVHGAMTSIMLTCVDVGLPITYRVVPMCSHGEVHWFGVLDGADPLALLIYGYGTNVVPQVAPAFSEGLIYVLREMAAFDDTRASNHLAATGSYSYFDEPQAVRAARRALKEAGVKS